MGFLLLKNVSSSCFCLVAKLCLTLFATPWTIPCQAPLSMGFPGKTAGAGCHSLLQGIFPTQGWNLFLLHWHADSSLLSHQGSPFVSFLIQSAMELRSPFLTLID